MPCPPHGCSSPAAPPPTVRRRPPHRPAHVDSGVSPGRPPRDSPAGQGRQQRPEDQYSWGPQLSVGPGRAGLPWAERRVGAVPVSWNRAGDVPGLPARPVPPAAQGGSLSSILVSAQWIPASPQEAGAVPTRARSPSQTVSLQSWGPAPHTPQPSENPPWAPWALEAGSSLAPHVGSGKGPPLPPSPGLGRVTVPRFQERAELVTVTPARARTQLGDRGPLLVQRPPDLPSQSRLPVSFTASSQTLSVFPCLLLSFSAHPGFAGGGGEGGGEERGEDRGEERGAVREGKRKGGEGRGEERREERRGEGMGEVRGRGRWEGRWESGGKERRKERGGGREEEMGAENRGRRGEREGGDSPAAPPTDAPPRWNPACAPAQVQSQSCRGTLGRPGQPSQGQGFPAKRAVHRGSVISPEAVMPHPPRTLQKRH